MSRRFSFWAGLFLVLAFSLFVLAQVPAVSTPEELQKKGDALRMQRDFTGALEAYRAAVARTPKDSRLWNKIGMVDINLGRYADARRDFGRAIKLDPRYAAAHNNLGVAFYSEKNYKKAIRYYLKALAMDPDSASFHNNLAAAYFSRKQMDLAIREYARAFELDPEIFERTNRGGEIAQMRSPEDRAAYCYMVAKLYAKSGNADLALEYLKRAIEDGYKDIKKAYTDAEFAALRKDARFETLMKREHQTVSE